VNHVRTLAIGLRRGFFDARRPRFVERRFRCLAVVRASVLYVVIGAGGL
jgi:hypothetical protein